MALMNTGRGGKSRRLGSKLQRARNVLNQTRQRISGYQSEAKGYKTALSNISSRQQSEISNFKNIQKAFYETEAGKNILNINQAYGEKGAGTYGQEGAGMLDWNKIITPQHQEHFKNIGRKKAEVDYMQKEYNRRHAKGYKSHKYETYWETIYKDKQEWNPFRWAWDTIQVATGQKKMIRKIDNTAEKQADITRKLNERTGDYNRMMQQKTGIGDKTYANLQGDIDLYAKSRTSKDAKAYTAKGDEVYGQGGTLAKLQTEADDITTKQQVTLTQLGLQQNLSKRYQSEMASLTSLWSGALREEQMKGNRRGGKDSNRPRLGQGYA